MPTRSSTSPLLALDAVVLDTETTSLDPAKARIVQIGAVRIHNGALITGELFDRLVDPGVPIPPQSTEIHHISDADVAGAGDFAAAGAELDAFVDGAVVIGHSIGYDLAILHRESMLAGRDFATPRSLDIRLLAQIANPELPGYSLDNLADWLGVEVKGRHSALGDAEATAGIFLALVPALREKGIRTLAEAEFACRRLTDILDEHHRAGWHQPVVSAVQAETEPALARIDSYPYRHRVRDVMTAPAVVLADTMAIGTAINEMMERQISSIYLTPDTAEADHPTADLGIITERDILRAIARHGSAALQMPARGFMSKPLAIIPRDAYIYRAVGRMSRLGIRHLAVADDHGDLAGALSARDLLRLRAEEAVSLGDEIESAQSENALAVAWAKLPAVARSLLDEDVPAIDIAGVISREIGALTRQAAIIAEKRMADAGRGGPPVPFALMVLGSGGRGESLLAADQDNAIIFSKGEPGGPEDRWFEDYGGHIADILNTVGVLYCTGGVMAKNRQWRGSRQTWHDRVANWVRRSKPEDLLQVDIFYDLKAVHGDAVLVEELMIEAYKLGHNSPIFAKLLAESIANFQAPLNFFGGIRTENGRVDLKKGGLFPIVSGARLLAIRHNLVKRSTSDRLQAVIDLDIGGRSDLARLMDAHGVILKCILAQQLADLRAGHPVGNTVEPRRLSKPVLEDLKTALESVSHIENVVRDLLFR